MNRKIRTLVCGSRFGQFYLEAIETMPHRFELVGLLAKGSDRSRHCAERHGIALYTDVSQLPADIDLACVVLRSEVVGGSGTDLSLKLLDRGIHVIQEHPVHHKDVAACLRRARQNGVCYAVGDLYVHLPAVRRFIAAARALLQQQEALYLDAACATQVSYPLMHILLEALPSIRPWKISHVIRDEGPFQLLVGQLGHMPITVRAHNEVDPNDPDHYLHLLHSVTIGTAAGRLSLVDTHGPVVWHPRLHVPDVADIAGELAAAHAAEDSSHYLGSAATATYSSILRRQWPQAIGRDLLAMGELMQGMQGQGSADTRAQQELLCARQWQEWTHALGYPLLRSHRSQPPLALDAIVQAALQEDRPEQTQAAAHVVREAMDHDVYGCTAAAEAEIRGLDARQVSDCVERLDAAALSSMLYTLQSQGTLNVPGARYGVSDIVSAAQAAPRHACLVARWLHVLAERGFLERREGDYACRELLTEEDTERRWHAALQAWEGKLGPRSIIDYLTANAKQLPRLLRDEQQAALLLFPEGRMDIAHALYRETAVARYLNKAVAEAVVRIAARKWADKGEASSDLRILEVGAGTGATTDTVVSRLQPLVSQGLRPDYLFTDITRFFITAAHERYQDCPWVRCRIVDIDQHLGEQGLNHESADIVIAAGMLNNARDTDAVVQNLMHCLVPGGWMLITEPTREYSEMLISQAFMMTRPADDRQSTQTTFMSVPQWLDVFRRANASEVRVLPDERHALAPLGQQLFIVRKGRDGSCRIA